MTEDNEEKNDYNFYNEKELLKYCKSIKRENKKSKLKKYNYSKKNVQNPKKEVIEEPCFSNFLNKLKEKIKWYVFISLLIIFLFGFYELEATYSGILISFPLKRFNIQIANYSITKEILLITDIIKLGNSSIAYGIRNSLLNQYIHIYNTNNKKSYNVIGIFDVINQDFGFLSCIENQNNHRYQKYKEKYLLELEKILKEYTERDISEKNFLEVNHRTRNDITYFIPNRIILYFCLANSYYHFAELEKIPINQTNLNKLKEILNNYDKVFKQEQLKESYHLPFSSFDRELYNQYYYPFEKMYSRQILLMENHVNPQELCNNKILIDKYLNSNESNINSKEDQELIHILKTKCSL